MSTCRDGNVVRRQCTSKLTAVERNYTISYMNPCSTIHNLSLAITTTSLMNMKRNILLNSLVKYTRVHEQIYTYIPVKGLIEVKNIQTQ